MARKRWLGAGIVSIFLIGYSAIWLAIALDFGGPNGALRVHREYAFRRLGNVPISPGFDDLRFLLEYIDCKREGTDPYAYPTTCDYRDRAFNYPSTWLIFRYFGLTSKDKDPIGIGIALLFAACVLLSFRRASPSAAVLGGMCAISPAVILGIERGNIDLIVFSMLVLTSISADKAQRRGDLILAVGILTAACLKLYPIAGIACFLQHSRKSITIGLATLGLFSLWLYFNWQELHYIQVNTPDSHWWSFGYKSVFLAIVRWTMDPIVEYGHSYPPYIPPSILFLGKLFLAMASMTVIAASFFIKWQPQFGFLGRCEDQTRFSIGSAIYVLTFMLGTNYAYRLAFLLLCIPQLVKWASDRGRAGLIPWLALTLICGVLLVCWAQPGVDLSLSGVINEIASWILFGGFGVILVNRCVGIWEQFRLRRGGSIGNQRKFRDPEPTEYRWSR
jgi:hypothetical protein